MMMFHPKGPTFWELARQALSSTEQGYDLLSQKFDHTPFRTPDVILQIAAEQTARLGPCGTALDICCGTGAAMQALRPHCSGLLVGLDRSRGMLQVAQRHLADHPGEAQVAFVRADALRMPFAGSFDVAVSFGALGHILPVDEPRFVRQIKRVLRPGGRFVFVTTTLPPLWSFRRLAAHAFNAAMRVRNAILRPPFIMYYLTFLLPQVQKLLEREGFDVEIRPGVFPGRYQPLQLVIATKRSMDSCTPRL